jgi:hypothetical protein
MCHVKAAAVSRGQSRLPAQIDQCAAFVFNLIEIRHRCIAHRPEECSAVLIHFEVGVRKMT